MAARCSVDPSILDDLPGSQSDGRRRKLQPRKPLRTGIYSAGRRPNLCGRNLQDLGRIIAWQLIAILGWTRQNDDGFHMIPRRPTAAKPSPSYVHLGRLGYSSRPTNARPGGLEQEPPVGAEHGESLGSFRKAPRFFGLPQPPALVLFLSSSTIALARRSFCAPRRRHGGSQDDQESDATG